MSFIDAMKKDYENEAQDDHGSSSKLLSNLDENTSKELQETIQKNAALIQELKVIGICHGNAMIRHYKEIYLPHSRGAQITNVISLHSRMLKTNG